MTEQRPMRGPFKGWRRLALWKQIFIALIAGLVVGVSLNMAGMPEVATSIKPIGDLFIRGIKMLIVPLVFVSLVTGVSSLNDISTMGRLSVKTVALRSEEHTSELQSRGHLVCRLLLEKKKPSMTTL